MILRNCRRYPFIIVFCPKSLSWMFAVDFRSTLYLLPKFPFLLSFHFTFPRLGAHGGHDRVSQSPVRTV